MCLCTDHVTVSLLTLQVKKLYTPLTLEPIADISEVEEMDDLSIGEGASLKAKPSASLQKGLQGHANMQVVSQISKESCSAKKASSCKSFPLWEGESVELETTKEGSEGEPGMTRIGHEGEPGMSKISREDEPGMSKDRLEEAVGTVDSSPEEEPDMAEECGEQEPGVTQGSDGIDHGTEPEESSVEDEPATASQESLLFLNRPSLEDIEKKSGYEAIWECFDKSQNGQAQDANIEASASHSEQSCRVEEPEFNASLQQKSGSFDDDQKPAEWHSVSLASRENQTEETSFTSVAAHEKSVHEADGADCECKEVASQSVLEPLSKQDSSGNEDEQQEVVGKAASCEAMQQCQQLQDFSGCILHQLSHCACDRVGEGADPRARGVKDFATVSTVTAEQNGTLPAVKQSTDDLGSDAQPEVTASISSEILNAASSHSC